MNKIINLEKEISIINSEIDTLLTAINKYENKHDHMYLEMCKKVSELLKKRTKLLSNYNNEIMINNIHKIKH